MKPTPIFVALFLALPTVAVSAPLRPAAPPEPKRFALEGTLSSAWFERASVLAGVRGRIRGDPFQFELSFDGAVQDHAQPDLRWIALGGGGLVRELSPSFTFYGTFLLGAYGVAVHDSTNNGGWETLIGPAVGVRTTIELRLRALRLLSIEPRLGISATLIHAGNRGHDVAGEHLTWGGPTMLLSIALGAESLATAAAVVPEA